MRQGLFAVGLFLAPHPPAFRGLHPRFLVGADFLGFGVQSVDLVLGNIPQFKVVEGPIDRVAVSFHGALVSEHEDRRNSFGVFLGLVENPLVQLLLHQGIQQIILLRSHVHTIENCQQISLGNGVTRPQVAVFGVAGLGRAILDLGELDHAGRGESRADAVKPRRIESNGAGQHQRPHHLRRPSDSNRVTVAFGDSQGGADLLRNLKRVSTARGPHDGSCGRRFGFFLVFVIIGGGEQMQGDATEVAEVTCRRHDQDHRQENRTGDFLANAHFAAAQAQPPLSYPGSGALHLEHGAIHGLGHYQSFCTLKLGWGGLGPGHRAQAVRSAASRETRLHLPVFDGVTRYGSPSF